MYVLILLPETLCKYCDQIGNQVTSHVIVYAHNEW